MATNEQRERIYQVLDALDYAAYAFGFAEACEVGKERLEATAKTRLKAMNIAIAAYEEHTQNTLKTPIALSISEDVMEVVVTAFIRATGIGLPNSMLEDEYRKGLKAALQAIGYAERVEENERLKTLLHEAKEVYAGMEGFIPQTAPESYLLHTIKQMYDALVGANQ